MKCRKCNYDNRADAIYCQQCGSQVRSRLRKVLLLRNSQSLAYRGHLAGYFVGYAFCGLIGSVALGTLAFFVFLFFCNEWGIPNPAGNSDALLMLVAIEIAVLSIYAALAVRFVKARIRSARFNLPLYRRDPGSRR